MRRLHVLDVQVGPTPKSVYINISIYEFLEIETIVHTNIQQNENLGTIACDD